MDSIHKGLSEAKLNYSKCLRSLEVISDDIHRKRKDKKMIAMLANLQEREAGVGADSEDETSLDQSQLDLDLDCNSSLSEVDGILPENLPDLPPLPGRGMQVPFGAEGHSSVSTSADGAAAERGNMSLGSTSRGALERSVSGAESTESVDSDSHASLTRTGSLKREVYGCEQDESEASECSSNDVQAKETGQIEEVSDSMDDRTATSTLPEADSSDVPGDGTVMNKNVNASEEIVSSSSEEVPNTVDDTTAATTLPEADSSDVAGDGSSMDKNVNTSEEIVSSSSEAAGVREENEGVTAKDTNVNNAKEGDEVIAENQTLEDNETIENQQRPSRDCVSAEGSDDSVLKTEDKHVLPLEVHLDNNNANQSELREVSDESTTDKSLDNGEWI